MSVLKRTLDEMQIQMVSVKQTYSQLVVGQCVIEEDTGEDDGEDGGEEEEPTDEDTEEELP